MSPYLRLAFICLLFISACSSFIPADEDIHRAAYDGNMPRMKAYFAAGGKVDTLEYGEFSLLERAAQGGQLEIVRFLILKGGDEKRHHGGKALIHYAASSGDTSLVSFLLSRGTSINYQTKNDIITLAGQTPLLVATGELSYGSEKLDQMISYLVHHGADVNSCDAYGNNALTNTILKMSDANRALLLTNLLVNAGANVNQSDDKGSTPLALASLEQYYGVVTYLVSKGAIINTHGEEGETALTYAAGKADTKLFTYFANLGANINTTLDDGSTVFMHALNSNNSSFCQNILKKYKYDIAAKDTSGADALIYAVKNTKSKTVQYVLDSLHISANTHDNYNRTPLMFAAKVANLDKIQDLFKYGALINTQDKYNKTSLMFAAEAADLEVIDFLLKHGALINVQDDQGLTPLMYLASEVYHNDSGEDADYKGCIEALLGAGARKDLKSKNGMRAIEYVRTDFFPDVKKLLQ